jgi:hypothetical protein
MKASPHRTVCLSALIIPLLLLPPLLGREEDKQAAREEIETLMEARDWKGAIKVIKKYARKYADTDEEKAEAQTWRDTAEGLKEIEEIQESYAKKKRARRASRDLMKVLEEYGHVEEVKEKAEEIHNAVRSSFVLVIEDFEKLGEMSEEDLEAELAGRRRSLVDDPKLVKQGDYAARWNTGLSWTTWSFDSPAMDWREYEFFAAWIYNESPGPRPGYLEIELRSGGWHYFEALLAIDWKGWREVRIPLRGKQSKFGKHGNADWAHIERIDFDHWDDSGVAVNIIIDDIRIEKNVP